MAEDIKLHDMKRSAKEKKAREREMAPTSSSDEDYHYGLRIHMDHDSLDKAGIADNPKPGDLYRVHGIAKVVRSDESADENGKRRNAEFHFHQIGFAPHGGDDETEGGGKKSLREQLSENTKESERKASEKSEKRAAAKTSTATAKNEAEGEDL